MNRRMLPAAALAAVLLATGCGRNDGEVVDEFQAHVSTGRVAEAAKLLAPNVLIIFDGTAYQGRAGAERWLTEARRRRLGFPVGRLGGARAGWRASGGRVSGVRLIHGEGYRPAGPGAELLSVQIAAEVRRGLITKITYDLTPAAKAALAAGAEQIRKTAAVFDGPPSAYNLGLFAANAVLEVGSTRVTGSPAIAGWVLSNRPASTAQSLTVQGNVVRWQGTLSTAATRQAGLAPRPARVEVDGAGAASAAPNIRRYTVVFEGEPATQPAPAASQPASQPAAAASQPASQPAPAASQPASASQPAPR
ncbi:MAG: hypothetical protein HY906_08780 [Deltaproteobacteria bacterium]|nr:hypothetical protein [Deltaproteobacteria bacterium]